MLSLEMTQIVEDSLVDVAGVGSRETGLAYWCILDMKSPPMERSRDMAPEHDVGLEVDSDSDNHRNSR